MNYWYAIFGMAIVTLATRAAPLLLMNGELSPRLRGWMSAVPVAVFAALALRPLLVSAGPEPQLMLGAPLVAGLAGAAVAWRTGSVVATIAVGMLVYWLLGWLW